MRRDLWGGVIYEGSDYESLVIPELSHKKKHKIRVNYKQTHSISTDVTLSNVPGIYAIYRNNILVYIGCTTWSIHGRVARFVAAVRGTERDDESHPAAYKYLEHFGDDVENLYVSFCALDEEKDLRPEVKSTDVEEAVISTMCPLFNEQTYPHFKFENKLVITNVKTGVECYA